MGHVSNFPGVCGDPAVVPSFRQTPDFNSEEDLEEILQSELNDEFSFLGDNLFENFSRNENISVPSNITSLIHADDEANRHFSSTFSPHDVLDPVFKWEAFDLPYLNSIDENTPAEDIPNTNESKEANVACESSPEHSNTFTDNSAATTTSEQSADNLYRKRASRKKKNDGYKKRRYVRKKPATYLNHDSDEFSSAKEKKATKKTTKQTKVEEELPKKVPKLIIKFNATPDEKKDDVLTQSEFFAPTIADKVKMGRRGQNGGLTDKAFKDILEFSNQAMKKTRRKKPPIVEEIVEPSSTFLSSSDSSITPKSCTSPEYFPQDVSDVESKVEMSQDTAEDLPVSNEELNDYEPSDDICFSPDVSKVQDSSERSSPVFNPYDTPIKQEIEDEYQSESSSPNFRPFDTPIKQEIEDNYQSEPSSPVFNLHDITIKQETEDEYQSENYSNYHEQSPPSSKIPDHSSSRFFETKFEPISPVESEPRSPSPEVQVKLESHHVPISMPIIEMDVKPKVPTPTYSVPAMKVQVPSPAVKPNKLIRPVVPLQRHNAMPAFSPEAVLRSPSETLFGSSSVLPFSLSSSSFLNTTLYLKREESSSCSSTTSNSRSSSHRHRSPSSKSGKSRKPTCQRCHRHIHEKPIKYDPDTGSLTDEFGRELRSSEKLEYKKSCRCKVPVYKTHGSDKRRSRTGSHDQRHRKSHGYRSRSRSSSRDRKHSKSDGWERACRSPSPGRRNSWREQDRPIEERRVLYVGDIPYGMSEAALRERFGSFGPIEDVQIKFKTNNHMQKIFGFITFKNRDDAYNAKENGNNDPLQPKFDLNFGGRRKFCNGRYTDLDGNIASYENRHKSGYDSYRRPQSEKDMGFEELLQMEKQRLKAEGYVIGT